MKLIKGEFKEKLDLLLAPTIRAGFPSPAEDYLSDSLDFNRDLIRHPEATFYGCVEGDSMIGLGIDEGDIAVIDRSIEAEHGDIGYFITYYGCFALLALQLKVRLTIIAEEISHRLVCFIVAQYRCATDWAKHITLHPVLGQHARNLRTAMIT